MVTETAFGVGSFAYREEPPDGNLRAVEGLARVVDYVVIRFAQDLRDGFALMRCARAQGSGY